MPCASSTAMRESAPAIETYGERIVRIHAQRSPDTLARIVEATSAR